ncbi:activating signal cointegrator 1 complex subunit 2 homolog [Helianthus annuus]|uniref:activating signal cointegrator 1 complex subunit 2 homolog n=1 Tax=Helianthus annuus TaxID=4232 RepID=UPI000B908742|nr:activating signal cointegrator 1 complex subunit 2 homolog [Helianthus annuus]
MDPAQPPPTMGQLTSSTPPPNSTIPTSTPEIKPTNTTLSANTQTEYTFSYAPTSSAFPQPSGVRRDGYDDGYEKEFGGYEEEGYMYGGDRDQGEYTYVQGQGQCGSQGMQGYGRVPQEQLMIQQIIPQQFPPQGPPIQRQVQQQQHVGQMFQQPPPQQFGPQRPQVQRPMGPPRPRVQLDFPRRHNWDVVRGIEAHFRLVITNNPSPIVIPQNNQGRTFEVRTIFFKVYRSIRV